MERYCSDRTYFKDQKAETKKFQRPVFPVTVTWNRSRSINSGWIADLWKSSIFTLNNSKGPVGKSFIDLSAGPFFRYMRYR